MAGTNEWPSCWHWTWRLSHGAAGSCSLVRFSAIGSGEPAAGASPWKKTAKLLNSLRKLLATDKSGDPMGRRGAWTGLRLRQISRLLRRLGLRVCLNTVRRLLVKLGYALHANRKSLGAPCAERNRQFHYLQRQRRRFAQEHAPIISVDTKKRELVGRFKTPDRFGVGRPLTFTTTIFPPSAKASPSHMACTMSKPTAAACHCRNLPQHPSLCHRVDLPVVAARWSRSLSQSDPPAHPRR